MDIALNIERSEGIPLFRRLAAALREAVVSQRLLAGQKMPSSQELADTLSISRATVVKAYTALISQGYLEAVTGGGTFVSRRLSHAVLGVEERSPLIKGETDAKGLSEYGRRILDIRFQEPTLAGLPELNYGSAPLDLLPWGKWKETLIKFCRLRQPNQEDGDKEVFGYRPLRAAIASYLSRAKGVICSPEQVILFEGSHAFSHIARLLIEPGDIAVIENPGYLGARENLIAEGAQLVTADVDEDGLIVEPLRKRGVKAKLCYLTLPHHDPTGSVMSMERRQELLAWARKNCTFIIEDGFDSDYNYGMAPIPALQALDTAGQVLYIYSFWKVLHPLASLGVLVTPPHLINLFQRAKFLTDRQFSILEHYALTELVSDGHLELHIRKTGKIYQARRQKLIFALLQQFRHYVSIPRQSGGLHTLVQFRMNRKSDQILRCAAEAGLPMASTSQYYVGDPRPCEFVIPFVSLEEQSVETIVNRFASNMFAAGPL
jgi:GntR family transcriptional regulator/MocR family aminotransferase